MDKKVFILNKDGRINLPFIPDSIECEFIEDADIVVFAGTSELSAEVCGETDLIDNSSLDYEQDVYEMGQFYRAIESPKVKLIIGLNRGANLICALNGGSLIQRVTNHDIFGLHMITNGTDEYLITSNHTQMQCPFNLPKNEYTIKYWAAPSRSTEYILDNKELINFQKFVEPEIVEYTSLGKTCLGIQGSPEKMSPATTTIKMITKLIENYVG